MRLFNIKFQYFRIIVFYLLSVFFYFHSIIHTFFLHNAAYDDDVNEVREALGATRKKERRERLAGRQQESRERM